MLYAILCYHQEDVVWSWSKEEDQAVMARIGAVQDRLIKAGKLGPSLRLLPTTSATTLRKTQDPPLVIDGPFAETKEQLLGFYVDRCRRVSTRRWRSRGNWPRPTPAAPTRCAPSPFTSPIARAQRARRHSSSLLTAPSP